MATAGLSLVLFAALLRHAAAFDSAYHLHLGQGGGLRWRRPISTLDKSCCSTTGSASHCSHLTFFATKEDQSTATDVNGIGLRQQQEQKVRPESLMAATKQLGRVPYGESSRKYRRTVFDYDSWVDHRSNERVIKNLRGMFFSGIVRQLQQEVLAVTAIAIGVVVWDGIVVPHDTTGLIPNVGLPAVPFQLSAPALGLLLVFRTNASYGRWLEARVTWGRIVSQSQNTVRMAATFTDMSTSEGKNALNQLALASWAFSRCLMNKLSGPEDEELFQNEMISAFQVHEEKNGDGPESKFIPDIITARNRPLAALMEASIVLDAIPIDEKRRVEIDKSLVISGDLLNACERIFTSPVPLVYTRHTARFLTLWMMLLPFGLYGEFARLPETAAWLGIAGLPLIPGAAVISLFLFGIEELAVQLEEPFSILPMQKFCDDIKASNAEIIEWKIKSCSKAKSK